MPTTATAIMPRHIPRKLTELGRIRLGDRQANSSGKGDHPHKLDKFRLTSSNKPLLEYAARHPDIGGAVSLWGDAPGEGKQWQLYTGTDALDVVIPTFSAVSLSYERWSTAGCEQRCTGEFITHCGRKETLIGTECVCPADDMERARLAQEGKACARILRLNVILPDLPGTGFWRLDTKGFYATAELLGTLGLLKEAGAEHVMIEAVLRLEQRTTKKVGANGGTLHFAVPVLWPKYTFRQIAAAKEAQQGLLMEPQSEPSPLVLVESAAKAADDLYGDGAGDIFRKESPQMSSAMDTTDALASIHGTNNEVSSQYPTLWEIISALHADLGWAAQDMRAWENKQARRFKKTYRSLPDEALQGLIGELQAELRKQSPATTEEASGAQETPAPVLATPSEDTSTETISAFSLTEEDIEGPLRATDIRAHVLRAQLHTLAYTLKDLALREEAIDLVADADSTVDMLEAKMVAVHNRLDEEAAESDIPF